VIGRTAPENRRRTLGGHIALTRWPRRWELSPATSFHGRAATGCVVARSRRFGNSDNFISIFCAEGAGVLVN
jgi:hypothetical protein